MASGMPSVIDLDAELATLTMFRRTPHSTREETKGRRLASLIEYSGQERTIPQFTRRPKPNPPPN